MLYADCICLILDSGRCWPAPRQKLGENPLLSLFVSLVGHIGTACACVMCFCFPTECCGGCRAPCWVPPGAVAGVVGSCKPPARHSIPQAGACSSARRARPGKVGHATPCWAHSSQQKPLQVLLSSQNNQLQAPSASSEICTTHPAAQCRRGSQSRP